MKLQNTWYCVRHGQGQNNLEPLITGHLGKQTMGLTALGKEQAEMAAKADSEWDVIIASPYLRAQQTAAAFSQQAGVSLFTEPRFEELMMGDLVGQSKEAYKKFIISHDWQDEFPNGESVEAAGKRALEAILEWDKKFMGKRILLVAHTILLRGLFSVIAHEDIGEEDLPHAAPFQLIVEEGWRMLL